MWRSYRRCNALQHWSLSLPISTSNIAKRSISAIFIRRDYFAAHRSTMAGDNRQTVVLKEEYTVDVVAGNLSRNTGDKHGTWKPLFCLLYYINFSPFFAGPEDKARLINVYCGSMWICACGRGDQDTEDSDRKRNKERKKKMRQTSEEIAAGRGGMA